MTKDTVSDFRSVAATGSTWQQAANQIMRELGTLTKHHQLGFVYVSEAFGNDLDSIEVFLRQVTGIRDWTGGVGYGVFSNGVEYVQEPGIAVMVTTIPHEAYCTLKDVHVSIDPVRHHHKAWLDKAIAPVMLLHADPSNQLIPDLLDDFTQEMDAYLIGGMTIPQARNKIFAHGMGGDGIGGVMFAPNLQEIAEGLTHSCGIISEPHQITACHDNIILQLDHRPALTVLKENVGDPIAQNLKRLIGHIFVGLPITANRFDEYVVRAIAAIDPYHGAIAVSERVSLGDRLLFCKRDHDEAVANMGHMLDRLRDRVPKQCIKGGLYISCASRGPNFFGSGAQELYMIEEKLGKFPLVGFYANGEISKGHIHTHTGVLTLFV